MVHEEGLGALAMFGRFPMTSSMDFHMVWNGLWDLIPLNGRLSRMVEGFICKNT